MLTIDLEKQLIKTNDLVLDEANKILKTASDKDLETLKSAGFRNSYDIATAHKEHSKYQPGRVFTLNQIKQVAIKYGLRFLPTSYYKGTVPADLPQILSEFKKNYNANMCILAPAESFNLQTIPKDPLLFGKIGEDAYYLVCKWGNDLSAFRWFTNFKKRDGKHLRLYKILRFLFCLIVSPLIEIPLLRFLPKENINSAGIFIIFLGITFLAAIICSMVTAFEKIYRFELNNQNDNTWNSPFLRD